MAIDSRHLANLLAVAEHGSFNRAAAARGLSQPALSSSIRQLERRLGVAVLERTPTGSKLNEFGEILVRQAQTVDALLLQAAEEVRLRKLGIHGPLRVGGTPSLMMSFLPTIVSSLLRKHPAAAISLTEGLDDQLLPQLRAGELDLIFGPVSDTPAGTDIVETRLFDDPFSIGMNVNHPLRRRRALTLAELRDQAWVLPGPENALRRHLEALFRAAHVPWPDNCVTTTSLTLIETILKSTNHIALITAMLQRAWRVRSIPLAGAGARAIGIKHRRAGQLPPLAAQFRQIAVEVAQQTAVAISRSPVRRRGKVAV